MTAVDVPAVERFPVGSVVTCRGREWTVQPGSDEILLQLKPLAGADNETVGVIPALEPVASSTFPAPTVEDVGADLSARLLRDAVRASVRDVPGPFRSFGKLGVAPRPYQLVPLMMALRLDAAPDANAYPSARLLIADDVGVGKTIEAGLVAAEMLASGAATGLSVLCPPHLADQWASELTTKFHLEPTKVLASTASRLERGLAHGESLFERYRTTVVSLDYIKARRRRDEYLQTAPDLVIVDEAHLCAKDPASQSKHLRHELLAGLAANPNRHLLLLTATPHSGKEGAFRSLVALLHPDLADVDPERDLTADQRDLLARHFVARKRTDIRAQYGEDAPFPTRLDLTDELGLWRPSSKQEALAGDVIAWARGELSQAAARGRREERVRWWSVLGLLRALASSPAAAARTLTRRAGTAELSADATTDDVDDAGRVTTLDLDVDEDASSELDVGAQVEERDADTLKRFAERASELAGPKHDPKVSHAADLARELVDEGLHPIFFCRFIATAHYLAEHLTKALKDVQVVAVTGDTPSDVREQDVAELATHPRRVLVATDCLSEGINLQQHFSAVVHYDLPWNPTRLEQREGRVDRYGQVADEVRVATIHGDGVLIDQMIRDVLLRKHTAIRNSLGIAIPVPGSSSELIEAVAERLFNVDAATPQQLFDDDSYRRLLADIDQRWTDVTEREKRSRSKFAQRAIDPTVAADQLTAARTVTGTEADIAAFFATALHRSGAHVERHERTVTVNPDGLSAALREELLLAPGVKVKGGQIRFVFDDRPPDDDGAVLVSRTHPAVNAVARYLLDAALDRYEASPATRVGVIATREVTTRTVLAVCRFRHDLVTVRHGEERTVLVEDIATVALSGDGLAEDADIEALLTAEPHRNLTAEDRREDAAWALDRLAGRWQPALEQAARDRAAMLLDGHRSVRAGFGAEGRLATFGRSTTRPHLPPDILAVQVLTPVVSL